MADFLDYHKIKKHKLNDQNKKIKCTEIETYLALFPKV